MKDPNDVERDAAIQRFKSTFEACWKAAKYYLYEAEGIDAGSPKRVVRSCREAGLLDEKEAMLALHMVNERNLTVHTYNEELAQKIHANLKSYYLLVDKWVKEMNTNLSNA